MTTPLLKPQDVAERLGCTVKTLLGLVHDGSLRFVNVGRGQIRPRYMFAESDLAEFEEARRQRNAEAAICPSTVRRLPVLSIRLPTSRATVSRLYEAN